MSRYKPIQNASPPLSFGAVLEVLADLPAALRTVRRIRRISLHQAAKEIGISHSALMHIETQTAGTGPRLETLKMLLEWLDKQPDMSIDTHLGDKP